MMISPDSYYELHLNGKTPTQITSKIRGLKNEIGRLKKLLQYPDSEELMMVYPSPETQLWCHRLYLERAKGALADAGGTYLPTRAEQKAAKFDASIPFINKLEFAYGGYFDGYETTTIDFRNNGMRMTKSHTLRPSPSPHRSTDYPDTRAGFLTGLSDLHIGEWKSRYVDPYILDGTQWHLDLSFSNSHQEVHVYGSNAYPYNFEMLRELMSLAGDCE